MKKVVMCILGMVITLGCARVRVEAPKDPIKVDIAMRLDIYQHVQKDINDIEDAVSGGKQPAQVPGKQSFLNLLVTPVYAAEGALSPEVQDAALRRKDRLSMLAAWESKGVIGENARGLVELRNAASADASVAGIIEAENSDRMTIYQALARKNGTAVDDVQKLYAKRLQSDAPAGTQVQAEDGSWKGT